MQIFELFHIPIKWFHLVDREMIVRMELLLSIRMTFALFGSIQVKLLILRTNDMFQRNKMKLH